MWSPTKPETIRGIPAEWCDMSDSELTKLLEGLVSNIQTLASALDSSRPDVALSLDMIVEHFDNIPEFEIKHTNSIGQIGKFTIEKNYVKRNFTVSTNGNVQMVKMISAEKTVERLNKEEK